MMWRFSIAIPACWPPAVRCSTTAPTTLHSGTGRWLASIERLTQHSNEVIVVGQGPVDRNGASIVMTRGYLRWLNLSLRDTLDRGLDMAEIMMLPLPAEYVWPGAVPGEFKLSGIYFFPELEQEVLPVLNH